MDYKRDSALSRDLFCITMRLFIQKLFRVEKYHQKGNLVRVFYVIYLGT